MEYRGQIKITYQLGGALQGIEVTEQTYKTKAGAIKAAIRLADYIEHIYSTWSEYDFGAIIATNENTPAAIEAKRLELAKEKVKDIMAKYN